MPESFERTVSRYDYSFPQSLIAQKPARPRDAARLLVYERKSKKVFFDTFKNVGKYLPKNAVLVVNETKVFPARLALTKPTGGKVRVLYIAQEENAVKVICDRAIAVGSIISATPSLRFKVAGKKQQFYFLTPLFPSEKVFEVFEKYGTTPIPPYIKHSPLSEKQLKEEYQAVFARHHGSVAAPTASLHFTKALLARLKKSGLDIRHITLHVNLGTFAPLTREQVQKGRLHKEWYAIDAATARALNRAKKEERPIIAVGTTVVRALESATRKKLLHAGTGETDLFIRDPYTFKFVDGIITNFHVPRSSLLMLIAAFTGRKILFDLYKKAIDKKFRLFSFGDGMLIL